MPRILGFLLVGWVVLLPLRSIAAAAAPAPVTYQQVRLGKAIVSLPAPWTTLGPEIPVWLHLHGAPEVVEREFATIGAPGVLVNVTLPGLSKVYADHFAETSVFPDLLRDVAAALRRESPAQAWRLGRITISSFSAGFGGVRELLKQPEAFERIATLVMADSIYCGYAGDAAAKRVDPALMEGFLRFARGAAEGRKRLLISHSRQVPEGYASTTETAEHLIQQIGGSRTEEVEDWPGGLRLLTRFTLGQFEVLGFDGIGPEDHMRHLRAIGALYARVAPAAPRSLAATLEQLRRQIQARIDDPHFRSALWGVQVVSLESGRTLFEYHPDRLLSPASNSKLYAGALALDRVGGDHRIHTPVAATAAPDAGGVVAGDVVVLGRGDPGWKSDARSTSAGPTADRRTGFWKTFEPFVALLRQAGVRRVTGDIVADATWFQMPPNGAGWTADDLNDSYGAEISAITFEDNYAQLRISPAREAGQPAGLALLQPGTGLRLDNRVATLRPGEPRRVAAQRIFGENVVHVFGGIPVGAPPLVQDVTVPRPADWFAACLREALVRAGIPVDGKSRGVRWPEKTGRPDGLIQLGEIPSAPMRELVRGFMKPSQNLETDLIFAHVGESTRATATPALRSSEQLAVAALREFLEKNKLPASEVRFEEGSGLSRNNLTTANATVALLRFMTTHRESAAFFESLPIAGVDGTLRRRMQGTAAEGNVRAKTGTLRYAIALSGYVTSAAGEKLAFSVMLNRAVSTPARNPRDDVDAIAVMLAQFAGRSEGVAGN